MPDFRENGVIRCARLESKKSVSGAVKKMCAAEWSRKMSRGGLIQPPPPGRFRVKAHIPNEQTLKAISSCFFFYDFLFTDHTIRRGEALRIPVLFKEVF